MVVVDCFTGIVRWSIGLPAREASCHLSRRLSKPSRPGPSPKARTDNAAVNKPPCLSDCTFVRFYLHVRFLKGLSRILCKYANL